MQNNVMKIQYLSDIHIELMHEKSFQQMCNKIVPKCDVLVLAGDIGNPLH
jgi:predicted phosphodiesterase